MATTPAELDDKAVEEAAYVDSRPHYSKTKIEAKLTRFKGLHVTSIKASGRVIVFTIGP